MNIAVLVQGGSIVLLCLLILAAFSVIIRTLLNGAPPMPSSRRVRARMMALVSQVHLPENATVVELGSGWGTVALGLSRSLPGATVVGYENSPVPFLFSVFVRRVFHAVNLRLVRRNFHKVSLCEADMVICYLSLEAMARLQPKFAAELKSSAVVISSTFALPGWKAAKVVTADDMYRTPIYLYPVGQCRSGAVGMHVDIVEPAADGDSGAAGPQ